MKAFVKNEGSHIYISYDEPMCVDPASNINKLMVHISDSAEGLLLSEQNLGWISGQITNLLIKLYSQGYLFVGENYLRNKDIPHMLFLLPVVEGSGRHHTQEEIISNVKN